MTPELSEANVDNIRYAGALIFIHFLSGRNFK